MRLSPVVPLTLLLALLPTGLVGCASDDGIISDPASSYRGQLTLPVGVSELSGPTLVVQVYGSGQFSDDGTLEPGATPGHAYVLDEVAPAPSASFEAGGIGETNIEGMFFVWFDVDGSSPFVLESDFINARPSTGDYVSQFADTALYADLQMTILE